MAVTQDKPAPYAPASAIIDLIGRFRSRGLPSPINGEVLARAGISDSLIPRTLYAMQALDLIDEGGAPTATFESLRLAPESEYQARQVEWLKGAYADVFAFVDLTEDDETSIRDAFRSYKPIGQQGRMVTLFQGLCIAAGLIPDKPSSTSRAPSVRPNATRSTVGKVVSSATQRARTSAPSGNRLVDLVESPFRSAQPALPRALAGLMESIPADGGGWTKSTRDKFVTTFSAVLDFCIPLIDENTATEKGGQS